MVVILVGVGAASADPMTVRVLVRKNAAEKTMMNINVFLMSECRCAKRIAQVTIALKKHLVLVMYKS